MRVGAGSFWDPAGATLLPSPPLPFIPLLAFSLPFALPAPDLGLALAPLGLTSSRGRNALSDGRRSSRAPRRASNMTPTPPLQDHAHHELQVRGGRRPRHTSRGSRHPGTLARIPALPGGAVGRGEDKGGIYFHPVSLHRGKGSRDPTSTMEGVK